jgi:putative intracellular protease/amidase
MNGKAIPVDLGLHEVDPAGYCAVAVIGGYRIYQYERHPEVERILRGVLASGGYVSGICAGSYVLGRAGLLTGKKVTGPKPHKLRRSGARYVGGPVQRDGRIITAKGPAAAEQFGEVLLNSVSGPLATMY